MNATHDDVLPAIQELRQKLSNNGDASKWPAKARITLAKELALLSDTILESAITTRPRLASAGRRPAVVPRGYFLLNLSQWDQEELRALCHKFGTDLRTMIKWGIVKLRCELREKIKIAELAGIRPGDCWRLVEANPKN